MYVWELLMQKRKLMFNKTSVVENFFNPPSHSATADKNSPQLAEEFRVPEFAAEKSSSEQPVDLRVYFFYD